MASCCLLVSSRNWVSMSPSSILGTPTCQSKRSATKNKIKLNRWLPRKARQLTYPTTILPHLTNCNKKLSLKPGCHIEETMIGINRKLTIYHWPEHLLPRNRQKIGKRGEGGSEKKEGMSGYTDKVQPDGSQIIIHTITKILGGAWQTNELCLIFYISLNQK